MRGYGRLAVFLAVALGAGVAVSPCAEAGKWVWTPDTGWQDINKLPRETPQQRYNYAVALATDGKYESALVTFEELLREAPKGPLAEGSMFYVAFCRRHSRDYWEAYRAVEALFQTFPNTKYREAALRTELSAGRDLARLGDGRGFDILKTVIQRDPQGGIGAEAQLEIGHVYFAQGRYVEARGAYQAFLTKFPESPLAETALFRRAESDVRVVEQEPKNASVARGAQINLKEYAEKHPQGQWQESAAEYAEVVTKLAAAKTAAEVQFYRALLEYYRGRYAETYKTFYNLSWWFIGLEMGEQAQYYYADCLARMGQTYQAFRAFEYLFSKYPSGTMTRKAIDREFELAQQLRKARHKWAAWAFGRVVANDPNGRLAADAQIEMADTYFEQQDYFNAKTAYQALQTAYPDSAWVPKSLYQMAVCGFEEAKMVNSPAMLLDGAQTKFEEYLERYPESANAEDAKSKIEEIREMKALIAFDIGKWYLGRGKHQAAVICFVSILRDYPKTKTAEEARKALTRLRPEAIPQAAPQPEGKGT